MSSDSCQRLWEIVGRRVISHINDDRYWRLQRRFRNSVSRPTANLMYLLGRHL